MASWPRLLLWILPFALPLAGLLLQLVFWEYVKPGIWFFFFPAVFINAWVGGTRMSLVASVVSAGCARYFFMDPLHSFSLSSSNHVFPLFSFVVAAALLGVMRDRMLDAQQTVKHRDHDLSLMFNTMSEAVSLNECVFDEKGEMIDYRVLRVNRAFYDTADFKTQPVVGSLATDLYGMSRETIRSFWMEHKNRSTVQQSEFMSPISQKHYIVTTSPFVRSHFVTSFFDITNRKRMEQELEAREADLLRAQALAHLGSYHMDLQTGALEWSAECKRIWGVSSTPLYEEAIARVHPEDLAGVKEAARQMHLQGHPFRVEYRIFLPDGSMRHVRDQAELLRGPDGVALAMLGTIQDITEARESEEALRQSESRFRMLVESINEIVYTLDSKGRYTGVYGAWVQKSGLTPQDYLGKTTAEILGKQAALVHESAIARALQGEYVVYEWSASGASGTYKYQTSLAPMRRGSDVTGIVGVGRDITQQKSMEEALERSARMDSLGTLARGIAHDFNNLLSGIFGHIEMAQVQSTDPRVTSTLARAVATIERAKKLTGQLLTFARGGAPDLTSGALFPMVEEAVSFALAGSSMRLKVNHEPGLWPAVFDPAQISQVLENIAINAKQAAHTEGTLAVEASNVTVREGEVPDLEAGDYVRISLRDNGKGIEKAALGRVFEPFFTTKEEGTGLGLATAYSIMRRHGGAVTAQSTPGQGATFDLYLPRGAAPAASSPVAGAAPPVQRKCKILVMDDQEDLRDVICDALRLMGHEAVAAADGEEALRLYRSALDSAPFDAAVLDLTIPGGLGGVEVTREIRKVDPALPILIVSGYANDTDGEALSQIGITASLQKPFTIARLSETLRAHLPG